MEPAAGHVDHRTGAHARLRWRGVRDPRRQRQPGRARPSGIPRADRARASADRRAADRDTDELAISVTDTVAHDRATIGDLTADPDRTRFPEGPPGSAGAGP